MRQTTTIKRSPLLIDEMLGLQDKHIPKAYMKEVKHVQSRLRAAKVFKFDEQAAVYAAHMMVDHPEAIARDIDFAIPPFERMYVEFPYPRFFDITSPVDYRGYSSLKPDEEDQDVGYLYDGPLVYVMSRVKKSAVYPYPMVLPLRYRLNKQFTYDEEKVIAGHLGESRLSIDSFMWGSCYKTLMDRKDTLSCRALRASHSCEFWYGLDMVKDVAANSLKTSAGDLRNIVGFTLFLNRTRELQIMDDIPPVPGFVRSKPRTLVRHSVVRIKLDPAPALRRVFASRATGGWRREHDVRGHWCADRSYHAANKGHDHDMREIGINQWKCFICGGQKWWRKAHHRGRKDYGQVKTTYEVTQ